MSNIPDKSVDLILCDLPYGTTSCSWDQVIPFDRLWFHYNRICKDNAAVALTCSQPFTSALIMSNVAMFKYCWYWEKERLTNITQVKKRAGKTVEEVAVFYNKQPTYNPQMVTYHGPKRSNKVGNGTLGSLVDGTKKRVKEYVDTGLRYPTQVLKFQRDTLKSNLHPTQKPVALMEYMVKTYTNPGDVVLDNCMGSGTTGVACMNLARSFIGIEKDPVYFEIARERIYSRVG